MSKEEEIKTAWSIWHLMERLNQLIWNRYEDDFIERTLDLEEEKYCQDQSDKDLFWETK